MFLSLFSPVSFVSYSILSFSSFVRPLTLHPISAIPLELSVCHNIYESLSQTKGRIWQGLGDAAHYRGGRANQREQRRLILVHALFFFFFVLIVTVDLWSFLVPTSLSFSSVHFCFLSLSYSLIDCFVNSVTITCLLPSR